MHIPHTLNLYTKHVYIHIWGRILCANRNDCTCCFVHIRFSTFSTTCCRSDSVISVRWKRPREADSRTVSVSCAAAAGRLNETDWQWRAGGGRQTVSHYERVPAQRSALLKKYIRQPHVRDFACWDLRWLSAVTVHRFHHNQEAVRWKAAIAVMTDLNVKFPI